MAATKYPFKKLEKYPHMKPADILIWERFIEAHPDAYDSVQYDLGVGLLPPFEVIVVPDTGGSDAELYLRKIDVVGFKDGVVDVIELKPNAGPGAVGQVEHNAFLYKNFVDKGSNPNPVIITDDFRGDVLIFAASKGVKIIQV